MRFEEIKRLYIIARTIEDVECLIEEVSKGASQVTSLLNYLELDDLKDKITKEVIEAAQNRITELKKEIEKA